jgi:hypothetical protein
MTIVLQFFPNGEFTQGVDTSKRRDRRAPKQRRHTPLSQECRDGYLRWAGTDSNADIHLCTPGQQFEDIEGGIYTYLCEDSKGHHYAYEHGNHVEADVLIDVPIGRLVGLGTLVPLVHQSVESSPASPKPSRKKLLTMTKNMGRNIRNGVYLLETQYGKDQMSFLTLTLPSLSTDELGICCDRWQDMTDQILKWLRKRLQSKGIEFEYVYCTELQSKRLQSRGEYAPHLHIVFRGRNGRKAPWAIAPKAVRQAWASIIAGCIGRRDFCTAALENIQRIKYSAARYLSKYLSKGNCSLPNEPDAGGVSRLVTQWGGMARKLSRAIKSCTARFASGGINADLAIPLFQGLDKLLDAGYLKYYRKGTVVLSICPVTGVERVLKVSSGALSTPTYEGGLSNALQYLQSIGALL